MIVLSGDREIRDPFNGNNQSSIRMTMIEKMTDDELRDCELYCQANTVQKQVYKMICQRLHKKCFTDEVENKKTGKREPILREYVCLDYGNPVNDEQTVLWAYHWLFQQFIGPGKMVEARVEHVCWRCKSVVYPQQVYYRMKRKAGYDYYSIDFCPKCYEETNAFTRQDWIVEYVRYLIANDKQ